MRYCQIIWLYSTASYPIPGIIHPRPFIITRGGAEGNNGWSRVNYPRYNIGSCRIKQLAPEIILLNKVNFIFNEVLKLGSE